MGFLLSKTYYQIVYSHSDSVITGDIKLLDLILVAFVCPIKFPFLLSSEKGEKCFFKKMPLFSTLLPKNNDLIRKWWNVKEKNVEMGMYSTRIQKREPKEKGKKK